MSITIYTVIVGLVIGILDIIPMIKQKISKYYTVSAFIFHFIMPSIVNNVFSHVNWWQSAILYFSLTLPLAIIIFKDNKRDASLMLIVSTIVGAIVGTILSII